MELRQFRSLIAVSEEKTFVKAARKLHLAQPALSRQIKSFETEIGTAVFERHRVGVTVTPAGEICLRAARSIITGLEEAVERARMVGDGRAGTCTIFVSQWTVWSGFLGKVLAHLADSEPGIETIVKEGPMGAQWEWLRTGRADVAIGTVPPDGYGDLRSHLILDDLADLAVVSKSHPLASRSSVRLEDLKDDVFLKYDAPVLTAIDTELENAFREAGFYPSRIQSLSTTEALLTRIAAGLGWSVHRRSLSGKIPGVVTVPIEGFALRIPIAVMRRGHEPQAHVLKVIERICEAAAEAFPSLYRKPRLRLGAIPSAPRHVGNSPDIRHLRYFAAVVEEQSIGRAARRLGLTQPALSRQMRNLDKDVATPLLERRSRGVVPTPAGSAFYKSARVILEEIARLPAEVERSQRAAAGRCLVASVPSVPARELLVAVLREAASRMPHLDVIVSSVSTPMQPRAIQAGEYDIGLCHPFLHLTAEYPDVECRELLIDRIDGALLPSNHPLAQRESIEFRDLREIPFLFFRRDFYPPFYDFVLETFRSLAYEPVLGQVQEGLDTIWTLGAQGKGWTLAFGSHAKTPPAGLVRIPIEGFSIPWGIDLLNRRTESRPVPLALIDLLFEKASCTQTSEVS